MGVQTLVFDTANSVFRRRDDRPPRQKVNLVVIPDRKILAAEPAVVYPCDGRFQNVSVFPDPIKTGTDSLFKRFQCSNDAGFESLQPRLGPGRTSTVMH
jgi:hypothetical protein